VVDEHVKVGDVREYSCSDVVEWHKETENRGKLSKCNDKTSQLC
jgi:hypothetical protein